MQSMQVPAFRPLAHLFRHALLAGSALLLIACQSTPVERDYDTSRDFNQYRTWDWAETAVTFTPQNDPRVSSDLTRQRILQAVSEGLDARGLRTADDADLEVQVDVISEEEEDEVTTTFGGSIGYWGWGWGGWARLHPVTLGGLSGADLAGGSARCAGWPTGMAWQRSAAAMGHRRASG